MTATATNAGLFQFNDLVVAERIRRAGLAVVPEVRRLLPATASSGRRVLPAPLAERGAYRAPGGPVQLFVDDPDGQRVEISIPAGDA